MRAPRVRLRTLMIAVAVLAVSMAGVGMFLRANDRWLERRGASRMTRAAQAAGYGVPAVAVIALSLGGVVFAVGTIPRRVAALRANLRRRPFERTR